MVIRSRSDLAQLFMIAPAIVIRTNFYESDSYNESLWKPYSLKFQMKDRLFDERMSGCVIDTPTGKRFRQRADRPADRNEDDPTYESTPPMRRIAKRHVECAVFDEPSGRRRYQRHEPSMFVHQSGARRPPDSIALQYGFGKSVPAVGDVRDISGSIDHALAKQLGTDSFVSALVYPHVQFVVVQAISDRCRLPRNLVARMA